MCIRDRDKTKADREAEKGNHYYRQRVCAVCGSTYWPTHSQDVYKRQEQELAEEDAIQAQQPEMDEETPKPTLGEQFEQYKPCLLYTS